MAAPPLLVRALPHLHPTLPAAVCSLVRRPCHTTTATECSRPIRKPPSITTTTTTYDDKAKTSLFTAKRRHPQNDPKWENDPDYRKWKDKESEIFLDINLITLLIKDILHSDRYMDGERLTSTDEKTVVEKVLAYHPHSENRYMKDGWPPGKLYQKQIRAFVGQNGQYRVHERRVVTIKCIFFLILKVDRHPQFRNSRCLFAVRTDGIWIDFSYQKRLRAYIRQNYPAYAERFIKEHYKRN